MKTTVKGIATTTFIAVLLMVGNVNATEIKALNSGSIEIEETLQMENWMTNENIWNTIFVNFVVEAEPEMELENWMTDAEVWNTNNSLVEEVETELALEDWMTDAEVWNTNNSYVEELETELTIEDWMTDDNIWNKVNNENTAALTVETYLMD